MQVDRLALGALETNCWVVSDDHGGPAVVIDPAADVTEIVAALGGRQVSAVILTHAHFDHLGAATDLTRATGAPLLVHGEDARRVTDPAPEGTGGALFGFDVVAHPPDRLLNDGETIVAGEVTLTVLHTPGHTQGGICLLAETPGSDPAHLFSGDTLFSGSVGRTDFPGGDARALSRSIATQLTSLDPETVVHPGHGPDTTIGRESRVNPFWPRG